MQDYLMQVVTHLGFEVERVEVEENERGVQVGLFVSPEHAGHLIGARAETLHSLHLLLTATFHDWLEGRRLTLNINDYREQREMAAVEIAQEAAQRAIEQQRPQYLPRLKAHQRRAVHQALSEIPGIATHSEGEGLERVLVIEPLAETSDTTEE